MKRRFIFSGIIRFVSRQKYQCLETTVNMLFPSFTQNPRHYTPTGGSFAPVWVAAFTWNGWQASVEYAI
jgi:hypothetical protein